MRKIRNWVITTVYAAVLLVTACGRTFETATPQAAITQKEIPVVEAVDGISLAEIPAFSGQPYVEVNDNVPLFKEKELTTEPFEHYSSLDSLGRCGEAYANICVDIMPTGARGSIEQVKPSGWHSVKYDIVDGKYLYNRCHLIGYQLAGENANEKNLITGTRYMNVDGMLPFENMVADYVKETNHHVLYRVTPVFEGKNLVAAGVLMEAESVEDKGEGVLFHVFVYNNQPGITIDYATGDSVADGDVTTNQKKETYILNMSTKKFHVPSCAMVQQMKASNQKSFTGSRDEAIAQGYVPCKTCNP